MFFRLVFIGFIFFTSLVFSSAYKNVEWNGVVYDNNKVAELVTIITTTNPIPSIPKTKVLKESQVSLFRIPAFAKCKKIIVFDGIQPEFQGKEHLYDEYKKNVEELTHRNSYFSNTRLVFCPTWSHLAGAVKEAMKHVTTPFVFLHQHDFVLQKDFDLNGLIATMVANPSVKHVRITRGKTNTSFKDWERRVDQNIEGPQFVPLCRTFGWSDNDHLATTEYYRDFVLPQCGHCAMEHMLQPHFGEDLSYEGLDVHKKYGTYLYGNLADGGYFHHSDGRCENPSRCDE